MKYADAQTGGREYESAGKDMATGAFSGVLAPVTAGLGGAVGKMVATKLGVSGGAGILKNGIVYVTATASDKSIGDAIDNSFNTAIDGGSISDVAEAAKEGFLCTFPKQKSVFK